MEQLAEIQIKLHVPKGEKNTFGKFNYRKAEGIIAAFKALEVPNSTLTMSDKVVLVGNQLFMVSTATLTIGDDSTSCDGWAMHATQQKGMDAAQITGSTSSYARKYALSGLFAIDDSSDDPDSKDNRDTGNSQQRGNEFDQRDQGNWQNQNQNRTEAPDAALAEKLLGAIRNARNSAMIDSIRFDPNFTRDVTRLEKMNEKAGARVTFTLQEAIKRLEYEGADS